MNAQIQAVFRRRKMTYTLLILVVLGIYFFSSTITKFHFTKFKRRRPYHSKSQFLIQRRERHYARRDGALRARFALRRQAVRMYRNTVVARKVCRRGSFHFFHTFRSLISYFLCFCLSVCLRAIQCTFFLVAKGCKSYHLARFN